MQTINIGTPPVLALTLGDPAGIGPEIVLKASAALAARMQRRDFALLIVGDVGVLSRAAAVLGSIPPPSISISELPGLVGAAVLPTASMEEVPWGTTSAQCGEQAFQAVALATRLAMEGRVSAVVTAPLNKEALHLAGHKFAGHTELLSELTGVRGSVMMLAHGDFRVSHVTTHCALEDVPRRATSQRIAEVINLTLDALRRIGVASPRVAVAALNPHAGEGGAFGRHDIDVTEPLVAHYRARGELVSGPVPGDTVFVKLRGGEYDAVVAMYHDQGHIPVKLLGFAVDRSTGRLTGLSGVNVTLGLPIIRTSVDHGTAFDIAGKGIANEISLLEAIDYALALCQRRAF